MAHIFTLFAALVLLFVQLPFKFNAKPIDSAPSVKSALETLRSESTGANLHKNDPDDLDTSCSEIGPLRSSPPDKTMSIETSKDAAGEYQLQQKILKGFRQFQDKSGIAGVNRYNIRQGGFTSDLNFIPPCISVQYKLVVTVEALTRKIKSCNEWIYIWTIFNANTLTAKLLLKLAVYDLRVFGFELCDPYKTPVNITINLEPDTQLRKNCQELCIALADFTTLVS